jgi:hypothetical protein
MHHWQTPQGYVIESQTFGGLIWRYYCQLLRQKFALTNSNNRARRTWFKKLLGLNLERLVVKTFETSQVQKKPLMALNNMPSSEGKD